MRYKFFSSLLVRNPVFSFRDYSQLDYNEVIKSDFFKTALYVASSDFYNEIQKKNFEYEKLNQGQKNTIKKYCNRACYRPTPFGAFSSISPLHWSEEQNSIRFYPHDFKVHLKVDYFSSLELCEKLISQEGKEVVLYKSNSSLYKVFRYFRYIKYDMEAQKHRRLFSINSLARNKIINEIIKFCATGKSLREIALFLEKKTNFTSANIEQFIPKLISEQIILPQSGSNITGDDCLEEMIRLLNENDICSEQLDKIETIVENLNKTSANAFGNILQSADLLQEMLCTSPTRKNLFYVVTQRGIDKGGINVKYQQIILDGLHCLDKLILFQKNGALENFKQSFVEKFESREVPLLLALDPEVGIGYENLDDIFRQDWLAKDIDFGGYPQKQDRDVKWTAVHSFLLNKMFQQHAAEDSYLLELTEEEINSIEQEDEDFKMPPSLSVVFRVYDNCVYLESAGGVSATTLIGRFSPFNDSVYSMAKEIALKEQETNQNVVFAEIAHICDIHAANINRRRHIRDYEIPIMVMSTLDESCQIPLSDLFVSVNSNNQIILMSMSKDAIVVPRLSSAFNYVKSEFSVFRFLCDLQYQGLKSNFKLDLANFFPGLTFYPRVVYKSAILCLASWQLKAKDIEFIKKSGPEQGYAAFLNLAAAIRLPRHFALIQNDNYLVFDKDNKGDIELLLDTIKNYNSFTLQEFIIEDRNPIAIDPGNPDKPLVGQYIASLYQGEDLYEFTSGPTVEKNRKQIQYLPETSDWLYFKIYCHPVGSNELLCNILLPMVNGLLRKKMVHKWFYVRYSDPDYHIRFRLHVKDGCKNEVTAIAGKWLQQALDKQVIYKYYTHSYIREMQRYSPRLIRDVECFFFRSSNMVLYYIKKYAGNDTAGVYNYNLDFILFSVDEILNSFELVMDKKIILLQNLYEGFYLEAGGGKKLKTGLDKKYNDLRAEMNTIYENLETVKKSYGRQGVKFYESSKMVADKMRKIRYPHGQKMIGDMIHMHLNRLFLQNARKDELIIYYLLYKHYTALYFKNKSVAR